MPDVIRVVRALIERHNGKMVYTRRSKEDFAGGLLCLPGGKIEAGETHEEALLRELEEEIGAAPDFKIHYCFSQEPREKGGLQYRQDYFHADIEYNMLRPGKDISDLLVMWPNDALLAEDIAFENGIAHHLYESIRRAHMSVPEWELADEIFQTTRSIPEPNTYAPSHHPLRSRDELEMWMRKNNPLGNQEAGQTSMDRWMLRHGLATMEEIENILRLREKRIERVLQDYQAGPTPQ